MCYYEESINPPSVADTGKIFESIDVLIQTSHNWYIGYLRIVHGKRTWCEYNPYSQESIEIQNVKYWKHLPKLKVD